MHRDIFLFELSPEKRGGFLCHGNGKAEIQTMMKGIL